MILGVGTDIVEIAELRLRMERTEGFSREVYDPVELEHCRKNRDPWPHLAARFAAKEAVMKALGTGWAQGIAFHEIVVVNRTDGGPEVRLSGQAGRLLGELEGRLHISLAHSAGVAMAFAVLEGPP